MSATTFSLKNNRLSLIHADWFEHFDVNDMQVLQDCSEQYLTLLAQRNQDNRADLLAIGETLAQWLNQSGWLERLWDDVAEKVWNAVFQVPSRPNDSESIFLNAPWELLAWEGQHLALDDFTWFNPMRRIGEAKKTLKPSPYRLNLMFMAAASEQVSSLSYEAEELAILDATQSRDLDLTVEETGMLSELADEVSRYQPDVVHISCHGGFGEQGNPVLLLENEEGHQQTANFRDWHTQSSLTNVEKGVAPVT
ncbi:CHAT domain-containing protein [Candidatus Albibeggiatoa sp. nov. NOAA]|uniref:CHAT domain-containing protein n=1 Tax=Candidatus Albibeggiatoa sp. nov. NOAA TaxID=3162724 RepID=UPI0032F1A8C2|nr:CHAT domain-containing protein [Thiotrichaceae bacterium]